jgi:hypothetical protein
MMAGPQDAREMVVKQCIECLKIYRYCAVSLCGGVACPSLVWLVLGTDGDP